MVGLENTSLNSVCAVPLRSTHVVIATSHTRKRYTRYFFN